MLPNEQRGFVKCYPNEQGALSNVTQMSRGLCLMLPKRTEGLCQMLPNEQRGFVKCYQNEQGALSNVTKTSRGNCQPLLKWLVGFYSPM